MKNDYSPTMSENAVPVRISALSGGKSGAFFLSK
jgi:hypothetical protein